MEENCEYQMTSRMNGQLLEVEISGEVTKENEAGLITEVFELISKVKPAGVLVDVRTVEGRSGIADAYFRARSLPPNIPIIKTAIVDLKEHEKLELFQETTAHNVGLLWKWFANIDSARQWLKAGG